MARVTVEDCVDKIPNRFELTLIAAHRARMLANGSPPTVDADNDKNPVIALREIADRTISAPDMRESLIHSIQKQVEIDEPEVAAAPTALPSNVVTLGRDSPSADMVVDTMTEEELLRGLQRLTAGGASREGQQLAIGSAGFSRLPSWRGRRSAESGGDATKARELHGVGEAGACRRSARARGRRAHGTQRLPWHGRPSLQCHVRYQAEGVRLRATALAYWMGQRG